MKKRFLSKSLIAKIALVIVIILVFEFAMAEPVSAAEAVGQLGGTLLRPIVNLVVYLADGVINILQSALLSMETSFLYIDLTDEGGILSTIKKVVLCTLGVVLVAGLIIGGIFALPVVGSFIAATSVGVAVTVAVRNCCRSSYCKEIISNSSCCSSSYVWKFIYICKYWGITRIYIEK